MCAPHKQNSLYYMVFFSLRKIHYHGNLFPWKVVDTADLLLKTGRAILDLENSFFGSAELRIGSTRFKSGRKKEIFPICRSATH